MPESKRKIYRSTQTTMKQTRHGLSSGVLPEGCAWIKRQTDELRRAIEQEVLARKNEVSLYDAALVNTAQKWERVGLLILRWLRMHSKDMSHGERLSYCEMLGKASVNRDKALRDLKLDRVRDVKCADLLYSYAEHQTQSNEVNDEHDQSIKD